MSKLFQNLIKKTSAQLEEDLMEARRELFGLRIQNGMNKLKESSSLRKARRNVARLLTAIQMKKKKVVS